MVLYYLLRHFEKFYNCFVFSSSRLSGCYTILHVPRVSSTAKVNFAREADHFMWQQEQIYGFHGLHENSPCE
jgi:hypothetical protein